MITEAAEFHMFVNGDSSTLFFAYSTRSNVRQSMGVLISFMLHVMPSPNMDKRAQIDFLVGSKQILNGDVDARAFAVNGRERCPDAERR